MSYVTCKFSGKRGFVTEADALRALRKARTAAEHMRRAGVKGIRRMEKRVYNDCQCGRWHLTSMSMKERESA